VELDLILFRVWAGINFNSISCFSWN